MLAVAIGRRVMLMTEESKTDNEMGFEYTHIKVKYFHILISDTLF